MSKVPKPLKAGLAAVLIAGSGGGAYLYAEAEYDKALKNEYISAVVADSAPLEVKLAMVMGAYYESSFKHIGTPYVDKLGKGQPLTVCNGVTGQGVIKGKHYTPADCYNLEKRYYEAILPNLVTLPNWETASPLQKASILDFVFNKGVGAFSTSTMRKKFVAGDIVGACRENPKWNRGTINGVSTVLPGLVARAESNAELCEKGLQ